MSSRKQIDKGSLGESNNRVSLGVVLNMPEHRLAEVLDLLESLDGVRLIYKKAAFYELYITPYPPSCWKSSSGYKTTQDFYTNIRDQKGE